MATTVQNVFDAALLWSSANTGAFRGAGTREILERVLFAEQGLFTKLAEENRTFYALPKTPASSTGGSGRTLDLGALTPPVERTLRIVLPDGRDLNLVDITDTDAELAPRGYFLGTTLYEIANEWSAAPGAVSPTVYYVQRPVDLNLAGDLTQAVGLPDRFAQYYAVDLAAYFVHKDYARVGNDPQELERLNAKAQGIYADIVAYVDHFHGALSRRFILPTPTPAEKR